MVNMQWHENELKIGQLCVGAIERDVPEDWRTWRQYADLPEVAPDNAPFPMAFRIAERRRYMKAEQDGRIWSASIKTAWEDGAAVIGEYPTEAEAKTALEAAVRAELDK